MKKIEAIIKPFKLDEVKTALHEVGVTGMTVSEVRGFGRPEGTYRGLSRRRIRHRFSAQGQNRGRARRCARGRARSRHPAGRAHDKIGDGKIFVTPIEEAVRIRTGERGPDAVCSNVPLPHRGRGCLRAQPEGG